MIKLPVLQQFGLEEATVSAVRALEIVLGSGVRSHVRFQTGVIHGRETAHLALLSHVRAIAGCSGVAGVRVEFPFFGFWRTDDTVFLLPELVGQLRVLPRGRIVYDLLRILRMLRTDMLTHHRLRVGTAVAVRTQEAEPFQVRVLNVKLQSARTIEDHLTVLADKWLLRYLFALLANCA